MRLPRFGDRHELSFGSLCFVVTALTLMLVASTLAAAEPAWQTPPLSTLSRNPRDRITMFAPVGQSGRALALPARTRHHRLPKFRRCLEVNL